MKGVKGSDIALYLNKCLVGKEIEIIGFSSLSNLLEGTVVFAKKYKKEYVEILNKSQNVLAIVCEGYEGIMIPHIFSQNPRLDFLRVVGKFFVDKDIPFGIHPSAVIEEGAKIGKNVSIGAHCYIASKVSIGDNTIILPNTSIYGKVTIGSDCYIKPGVVIGGPGFGFEYDENEAPVHFPHTGEVVIGNRVYIGANTTIDRATIDSTIIEDNVKIDNLVHIAHNCKIGMNTLITGGAMLGGGVVIGANCWIAPNSTMHQQLRIENKSKVGIGAVVVSNIKEGVTVFGNPAKVLKI